MSVAIGNSSDGRQAGFSETFNAALRYDAASYYVGISTGCYVNASIHHSKADGG